MVAGAQFQHPQHSQIAVAPGGAGQLFRSIITIPTIRFLSLAAAAAVTKTIKLATGMCLVVERNPIHTAEEESSPSTSFPRAG